jgi:CheY-like chemotaxis protein/two-component sensor histidine kinase
LEKVVHESNRAAKLVSNFLSFARERATEREAVCLNQLIQRIFELREMDLRVIGAEAELHLEPDLPLTMVDATQIEQVLVNLVTNAIHALAEWPKARRFRICSQLRGDLILLQVEDSGPGIAKEVLPHIFEPFFTTKPIGTGTGLGLSIAHSIVTEHGGRIYYRPRPEGGAGFVVELPSVKPEGEVEEESARSEGADQDCQPDQSGARVLVVDDEPVLGELLAELLSSLGHSAVTCTSALTALDLLATQRFDVILSDYRMPRMNGREFYERVRAREPDLARRIVFVTGDVINQETRAFLEAVGNAHLAKPFRPEGIATVVRRVLAGRMGQRAEREPAAVG